MFIWSFLSFPKLLYVLLISSFSANSLVEMKVTRRKITHLPNIKFKNPLETQSYSSFLLEWRMCPFYKSQTSHISAPLVFIRFSYSLHLWHLSLSLSLDYQYKRSRITLWLLTQKEKKSLLLTVYIHSHLDLNYSW